MVMNALREGAKGGITKFILFGFLVLATAGLVLMDVGGVFRGGLGSTDVAVVGNNEISAQSFDRTLRGVLPRLGLSPQEAYRLGYINQLLGAEVRGHLLHQAAAETGIQIGKKRLAQEIQKIVAPYTSEGQSEKDVLNRIVMNQGMSEAGFVQSIARDMGNELLTSALRSASAYNAPEITQALYKHQNEARDVEYILFKNSEVTDIPAPDEEKLLELYEATRERYAKAETRRFKILTIKTEHLKKTLDISEDEVRQTYEDNVDYYITPASRTLDQAVLNTQEDANAVVNALNNGQSLEAAVKEITGQLTGYLGSQDFAEDNILEQVKDEVMAAQKVGEIVGPISSPLGWYVVVVKKISAEKARSFDEVKKEIREEIMETALIDEQYNLANTVDDLLAGGASLEDVKQEVDLDIQTLPAVTRFGQKDDGKDGLADYKELKSIILETGFTLEEGETSAIFEGQDNKFRAIYLEQLSPKTYKPFEEVRNELSKSWIKDQKQLSNRLQAMESLKLFANGEISFGELAKQKSKSIQRRRGVKRSDDPDGSLSLRSVSNLFEAPLNKPIILDLENGIAFAQVTKVTWPKSIKEESEDYKALEKSLSENIENEALSLYVQEKQDKYGVRVNQSLLNRFYGPESQSY